MYKCPTCHRDNAIVNQCRCDPNNLPTHIYSITKARYAKGMMAVQCPSTNEYKTSAGFLAEVLSGGRWTGRECAYIMSPAAARKFEALLAAGWRGQCIGKELIAPDGSTHPSRNVRISKIGEISICQ